jgi:hypothetical protein
MAKTKAPEVHCAHDELVKVADLRPTPGNPNHHSDGQVKLLAKIIQAQGWRAPITVSKRSGQIVRGHCRLMAAQLLKLDKAPVDYQDYDSDEAEWADLLSDNRLAELADLNMGQVADILGELDTGAFDMDLTGWIDEEMERVMTFAGGFTPDDTHLPNDLPPPDLSGADDRTKVVYLLYNNEGERDIWFDRLGLTEWKGKTKDTFTLEDLPDAD